MPFISEILKYASVSIAGMEKNTGKTETLNYILQRVSKLNHCISVTSIGLDGEQSDQVTHTPKPAIKLYNGMIFTTSEKHYLERQLVSEVLHVSQKQTALGRLITAKVVLEGKITLSGPSETHILQEILDIHATLGAKTSLIDGALSRRSHASPAISKALLLTTGAAFSFDINKLIHQTKYIIQLIDLEQVNTQTKHLLQSIENGIWGIDKNGQLRDLEIKTAFHFEEKKPNLLQYNTLFLAGVLQDKLLNFLRIQDNVKHIELIVNDFTKIFASETVLNAFLQKGGKIKTLYKTKIIALTVNPTSVQGYCLNSALLQQKLKDALQLPVYDVRTLNNNH
ncbi:MAG: hypothetical protein LBR36_02355 [Bacteroidales bacterium]|jgi:hypothetical protein|nr:hypothetical protein [Bacteroidales bacterium]